MNKLAAVKHERFKLRLIAAYDNYVADSVANETAFWNAVLDFARMKIYYLELEFSSVGTTNTVDDYAQEVALAVWTGLETFSGDGPTFYSWVHAICYNQAAHFFKEIKNQKTNKVGITVVVEDEQGEEEEIDNPELHSCQLRDFFITIPKSVQGVDLAICHLMLDGINYAQIGKMLGMSETAVKLRMYKLRKRLAAEKGKGPRIKS